MADGQKGFDNELKLRGDFRSELLTTTVTSNPSQELTLNLGGSWNAGILIRPVPQFSLGAAYRSKIKIDFGGVDVDQQVEQS